MDSISELLSSVSPEELERLKGVAQSLIAQNGTEQEKRETPPQKPQENPPSAVV